MIQSIDGEGELVPVLIPEFSNSYSDYELIFSGLQCTVVLLPSSLLRETRKLLIALESSSGPVIASQ